MKTLLRKSLLLFNRKFLPYTILFCVALLAIIYSFNQENKLLLQRHALDSLNKEIDYLSFHPVVLFDEKLEIKNSVFEREFGAIGEKLEYLSSSGKTYILYKGNININTEIKITNISIDTAYILGVVSIGIFDTTEFIRSALIDSNFYGYDVDFGESPLTKDQSKLKPYDSRLLDIYFDTVSIKNGDATLHCMVLYLNQTGLLFDAYSIFKIENLPTFGKDFFELNNKVFSQQKYNLYTIDDKLLKCTSTQQTIRKYSPSETKQILKKLRAYTN